jgi:MerR family transcriptional regulator, glutamine synthetase repressor
LTRPRDSDFNRDDRFLPKYTMAVTVRITGIAAYKIRRYEEFGLCEPERTNGQQRLFSDVDIEIIRKILIYEQNGVNLKGIKYILNLENIKDR